MGDDFLQACQPGKSLERFYNDGNINNAILHVRAIVDADIVVYRVWVRRRQVWSYRVEVLQDLHYMWERGTLRPHGRSRS